jgi:hypothetical protein
MNMLAGGFKNDLITMNDSTPHDRRYDRPTEYTQQRIPPLGSTIGSDEASETPAGTDGA